MNNIRLTNLIRNARKPVSLLVCSVVLINLLILPALAGWEKIGPDNAASCPAYGKAKNGDINGDGVDDWRIYRKVDGFGNDVEEWCIDPDGRQNNPDEGDPYDEYFAKLFSKNISGVEEKYFVGKCPWEGGFNEEWVNKDAAGAYIGLKHRSTDKGADDAGSLPGEDYWEYEYNATTHMVTQKHFTQGGTEVQNETKTPKKNSFNYNDLLPSTANATNFTWAGNYMYESGIALASPAPAIGGFVFSVDKLGLLAPYIFSTIALLSVGVSIYIKRSEK